ncbi:MAG: hypothetical protein N2645_11295 [Clostridia bacterium]|nr:hypothetical protein [Clostridia bacterium]
MFNTNTELGQKETSPITIISNPLGKEENISKKFMKYAYLYNGARTLVKQASKAFGVTWSRMV